MTGLEKIIGEIKSESDSAVRKVTDKARAEADSIIAEAMQSAEEEADKIRQASETAARDAGERAKSAADLRRRRAILAEKQKLIAETIAKAKKKVEGFSDEEYFENMKKLIGKNAGSGKGTLHFAKQDLARMPKNFSSTLGKFLPAGADLTISSEPAKEIDRGFVLVYGGVEENCSLDAVFEAQTDILQDRVKKILFG